MHFSAKRGIAITMSVRPSVTLVDQEHVLTLEILKLIARTISPTPSLFVAQRPSTYSQWNMEKNWGRIEVGGKKWRVGAQKQQYL